MVQSKNLWFVHAGISNTWLRNHRLFFDEKDTFKVIYKDEFAFCNCNRTLEYLIARYRKLKGGE